jgi:hypothetical protein
MEPENFAEEGAVVPRAKVLEVKDIHDGGDFVKVTYDGFTGWLKWATLKEVAQDAEEERREAENRARTAQIKQRREELRQQGFGLMLSSVGHSVNSADGISVGVFARNIDEERTIKYITFTVQLFNPVGDLVYGESGTPSETTLRGVGPIKPGGRIMYKFDNTWYSPTGDCVEIHRIHVEYMNGSGFTYVNDLEPISRHSAQRVNLAGECQDV